MKRIVLTGFAIVLVVVSIAVVANGCGGGGLAPGVFRVHTSTNPN